MAARRFFNLTLRHSTIGLWKYSLLSKTEHPISCLHQHLSRQVAWKQASFRSYVTAEVKRAHDVIKKGRLSDVIRGFNISGRQGPARRFLHRSNQWQRTLSFTPWKMYGYIVRTMVYAITPGRFVAANLTGGIGYTLHFYNSHLVQLPLGDRRAFRILTDGESMRYIHEMYIEDRDSMLRKYGALTMYDRSGNPIDERTQRVMRIMAQIRSKNPECDEHLIKGMKWQAVVCENILEMPGSAVALPDGMILIAKFLLNSDIDDDELAYILAHEMVHTINRHWLERMGARCFFEKFGEKVLSPLLKPSWATDGGFSFGDYFKDLALKFNFPDTECWEREADYFGFKMAAKACFDYKKFAEGAKKFFIYSTDAYYTAWRARNAAASPQQVGNYEEDFTEHLRLSKFNFDYKHPTKQERLQMLKSADMLEQGRLSRLEGECE